MPPLEPLKPGAGRLGVAALVALVVALLVGAFWWQGRDGDPVGGPTAGPATSATPTPSTPGPSSPATTPSPSPSAVPTSVPTPEQPRVVVVSVDGLASYAVTRAQMPVLTRLLRRGAGTLNARTAVEMTVTLPNHTGMVTGRRIDQAAGGHGVTWNEATNRNVRPGVASVFSVVHDAGGESAVFVGKAKFAMWPRSWPGTIDEFVIDESVRSLTDRAVDDLHTHERDLTFLHLAAPDAAGHAKGWDSPSYDAAVAEADRMIGRVVRAIRTDPQLAGRTILVVTADHGGVPGTRDHGDSRSRVDFQIPFVVWGPGVAAEDLYALNPDYADPGERQPSYSGPQPVRNAAVANLVTDLLGLRPVPGSQIDAGQDLDVR